MQSLVENLIFPIPFPRRGVNGRAWLSIGARAARLKGSGHTELGGHFGALPRCSGFIFFPDVFELSANYC
jgi:hypothetical protein